MSAAAASDSDWANLLPDLLEAIARRVGDDERSRDRSAFAAVCRPWRRTSSATGARLNRHSLHLVSLRPGASAVDFSSRHGEVVKTAYLGSDDACTGGGARPHRVIGCSGGWLVVVDRACGVSLLEPVVDGRRLPLPPVTAFDCGFITPLAGDDGGFSVDNHAYRSHIRGSSKKVAPSPPETVSIQAMRDEFFHKAALSATATDSSHPESFTVMVIHSGGSGLAFARPGDKSWTSLRTSASTRYADVVHHNGAFYALTRGDGSIEAWEPVDGRRTFKPRLVTGPVMTWEFKRCVEFHSETFRQPAYYEGARYLAERDDDGGLLVVSTVAIFDDGNALRTRRFKVFGVDEREGEWRELQDVGDETALLVGINHGRRVSTREYQCLKPNCVHYVLRSFAPEFDAMDDEDGDGGGGGGEECSRYESGVYDLRSGKASRKSVFRRAGGGHPVWFVPPGAMDALRR